MKKAQSHGRFPKFIRRLRPTLAEVEHYARLIMRHERRPLTAFAACLQEAEFQLWAMRSWFGPDAGREPQAGT
ncbi:MAG: hypothetical protein ABUL68_00830 [Pseudomonadota bacterium]